jgi:radical SAM protein with 4Fe4S-binding SPASM domain
MDLLADANPIEKRLVEKANRLRIPITTAFELTPVCNLNCRMCYVRLGKRQADALGGIRDMAFWLDLAEQFMKEGNLFILLTGGEPLLYPQFKELYTRLHEMGIVLSVNTNALLLDEETADLFVKYPPRFVRLTLYGASNETYERLCHVKEGYTQCMHGIDLLQERGINTRINLTMTTENQADFLQMLYLAHERGIFVMAANYISVFSTPEKGSEEILQVRNTPGQAALNEIRMKARKDGKDFARYVEEKFQYLTQPVYPQIEGCDLFCRAGKSSCWVNWKGELKACVDLPEPSYDLKTMPVKEAWEQLKEAVTHLPIHTECKNCKLKPFCDVCYANATNEKKHCGSLDYLCQMAHAKADILYELHERKFKSPQSP